MEGYEGWYSPSTAELEQNERGGTRRSGVWGRGGAPPAELEMEPVGAPGDGGAGVDGDGDDGAAVVLRRKPPPDRRAASEANRKSVVILSIGDPAKPARAPPSASGRMSRLFPDVELQPMMAHVAGGGGAAGAGGAGGAPGEPIYEDVPRWPWVLLAGALWIGSLTMLCFGGICVNQFYAASVGEETTIQVPACGPAGGASLCVPSPLPLGALSIVHGTKMHGVGRW
jgi:hypothetical protein